jgi:hypothetical protein
MSGPRCPGRHTLPHQVQGVSCTPTFCKGKGSRGGVTNKLTSGTSGEGASPPASGAAIEAALAPLRAQGFDEEALASLGAEVERYERRRALMRTPAVITVEEAKAAAEKSLALAVADAADRLVMDLKYGNDDVSRRAALEILDRQGFGKKEGYQAPGAPIVIVNATGTDSYSPPWVQRVVDMAKKPGGDGK